MPYYTKARRDHRKADTFRYVDDELSKIDSALADIENRLTGWRDMLGPFASGKIPAASAPTWAAFGSDGVIYQYQFALNDIIFVSYHADHDMEQSATMYPHMHWSTSGTDTNTVKWRIDYSIAARIGEAAFPAVSTVYCEAAPNGTAWSHYVTEAASGVATPTVDSMALVKITRVTNGGTDNTDDVFGLTMDWHYPVDRYATPSRDPDFYT